MEDKEKDIKQEETTQETPVTPEVIENKEHDETVVNVQDPEFVEDPNDRKKIPLVPIIIMSVLVVIIIVCVIVILTTGGPYTAPEDMPKETLKTLFNLLN